MSSFPESILLDTELTEVDGVWTLFYEGHEYMRLLNAASREEAEQQIAEMLFVRGDVESGIGPATKPEPTGKSSSDTRSPESRTFRIPMPPKAIASQ